jgi:hypothetical protein
MTLGYILPDEKCGSYFFERIFFGNSLSAFPVAAKIFCEWSISKDQKTPRTFALGVS